VRREDSIAGRELSTRAKMSILHFRSIASVSKRTARDLSRDRAGRP